MVAAGCLLVAGVVAAVRTAGDGDRGARVARFDGPDRLLATEHQNDHALFELTSGSLFVRGGRAWSGALGEHPDSAVLRARTREVLDVSEVTFSLRVAGLTETVRTPAQDYDGVSVGLRYQSPDDLYYVNLFRRDGAVTVKRKRDGEYVTLAQAEQGRIRPGEWSTVRIGLAEDDDSVSLSVTIDGHEVVAARDNRAQRFTEPGRFLLRGDNAEFEVDDLRFA